MSIVTTRPSQPLTSSHAASHEEHRVIHEAILILERKLIRGKVFDKPNSVKRFCQLQIAGDLDECFCCLFLSNQHKLISFERLFQGTISSASVYPRVVVRRALELNAAAVIFTHNHPSGGCDPSEADYRITQRLKEALALVEVRVIDHIVVAHSGCISIAEQGRL